MARAMVHVAPLPAAPPAALPAMPTVPSRRLLRRTILACLQYTRVASVCRLCRYNYGLLKRPKLGKKPKMTLPHRSVLVRELVRSNP